MDTHDFGKIDTVSRWYYTAPYIFLALMFLIMLPWGMWVTATATVNAARSADMVNIRNEMNEVRETVHKYDGVAKRVAALEARMKRAEGKLYKLKPPNGEEDASK